MSQQIEPTYLRYIYDGLAKGAIHPDNASALPEGLNGMYEEVFDENTPVTERQKLLKHFGIWALLKKEVSANFVAEVLGEKEEVILNFIATYSKWFNSPESGKYQLYHEKLRCFLLQKVSDKDLTIYNRRIITIGQIALIQKQGNEWEKYALEYLSSHLLINAMRGKENGQELKSFAYNTTHWNRQIEISKGFDWSKKMLNEMLLWAAKYDGEELIECALNKVDLNYIEQNDAQRIVELVAQNDIETALQRIKSFGGNTDDLFRNKFLLYLVCLIEILANNKNYKTDVNSRVNILLEEMSKSIPKDYSVFKWRDFLPTKLVYHLALELNKLELNYLTLFDRTDGCSFNWLQDYELQYDHEIEIIMSIINNMDDLGQKWGAEKHLSLLLGRIGQIDLALKIANNIDSEIHRVEGLLNLSSLLIDKKENNAAKEVLFLALDLLDKWYDPAEEIKYLLDISNNLFVLGEYKASNELYDRALLRINNGEFGDEVYLKVVRNLCEKQNYIEANAYIENFGISEYEVRNIITVSLFRNGNLKEGYGNLNQIFELATTEPRVEISKILYNKGMLSEANEMLTKSLEIILNNETFEFNLLQEIFKLLSKHHGLNDFDNYFRYIEYKISYTSENNQTNLLTYKSEYANLLLELNQYDLYEKLVNQIFESSQNITHYDKTIIIDKLWNNKTIDNHLILNQSLIFLLKENINEEMSNEDVECLDVLIKQMLENKKYKTVLYIINSKHLKNKQYSYTKKLVFILANNDYSFETITKYLEFLPKKEDLTNIFWDLLNKLDVNTEYSDFEYIYKCCFDDYHSKEYFDYDGRRLKILCSKARFEQQLDSIYNYVCENEEGLELSYAILHIANAYFRLDFNADSYIDTITSGIGDYMPSYERCLFLTEVSKARISSNKAYSFVLAAKDCFKKNDFEASREQMDGAVINIIERLLIFGDTDNALKAIGSIKLLNKDSSSGKDYYHSIRTIGIQYKKIADYYLQNGLIFKALIILDQVVDDVIKSEIVKNTIDYINEQHELDYLLGIINNKYFDIEYINLKMFNRILIIGTYEKADQFLNSIPDKTKAIINSLFFMYNNNQLQELNLAIFRYTEIIKSKEYNKLILDYSIGNNYIHDQVICFILDFADALLNFGNTIHINDLLNQAELETKNMIEYWDRGYSEKSLAIQSIANFYLKIGNILNFIRVTNNVFYKKNQNESWMKFGSECADLNNFIDRLQLLKNNEAKFAFKKGFLFKNINILNIDFQQIKPFLILAKDDIEIIENILKMYCINQLLFKPFQEEKSNNVNLQPNNHSVNALKLKWAKDIKNQLPN